MDFIDVVISNSFPGVVCQDNLLGQLGQLRTTAKALLVSLAQNDSTRLSSTIATDVLMESIHDLVVPQDGGVPISRMARDRAGVGRPPKANSEH